MIAFTKFDAQIIQEYVKLNDIVDNEEDKWIEARENADNTLHTVYLSKIMGTSCPPKAYVQLEGRTSKHCSSK